MQSKSRHYAYFPMIGIQNGESEAACVNGGFITVQPQASLRFAWHMAESIQIGRKTLDLE